MVAAARVDERDRRRARRGGRAGAAARADRARARATSSMRARSSLPLLRPDGSFRIEAAAGADVEGLVLGAASKSAAVLGRGQQRAASTTSPPTRRSTTTLPSRLGARAQVMLAARRPRPQRSASSSRSIATGRRPAVRRGGAAPDRELRQPGRHGRRPLAAGQPRRAPAGGRGAGDRAASRLRARAPRRDRSGAHVDPPTALVRGRRADTLEDARAGAPRPPRARRRHAAGRPPPRGRAAPLGSRRLRSRPCTEAARPGRARGERPRRAGRGDGSATTRLPPEIETAIYRVRRRRRSRTSSSTPPRATSASCLTRKPECVSILVEDDGMGFAGRRHRADGLGLVGMRERAEMLGGTLRGGVRARLRVLRFSLQLPLR